MYDDHPSLAEPHHTTQIWRYRSLDRFEWIIDNSQLYFARADKMEDAYEGTLPDENFSEDYRERMAERARESMREKWQNVDIDATKEMLEAHYDEEFEREEIESMFSERTLDEATELVRDEPAAGSQNGKESHFLNCWHINNTESNLMWGTYSDEKGIAIKSRLQNLKSALDEHKEHDIFIGEVTYLDYSRQAIPEGNALYPYIHKREQFKEESELRAIIHTIPSTDEPVEDGPENAYKIDWSQQPEGIRVSVDLNELINEIYLAPGTSTETSNRVAEISESNGLSEDLIEQSTIDESPPDRS